MTPTSQQDLTIYRGAQLLYRQSRTLLQQTWSATSHQMQRIRDNPACADQEFNDILDISNPGLSYHLKFDPAQNIMPFFSKFPSLLSLNNKPRVAILREEGTNGQSEMAFAFMTVSLPVVTQIQCYPVISSEQANASIFQGWIHSNRCAHDRPHLWVHFPRRFCWPRMLWVREPLCLYPYTDTNCKQRLLLWRCPGRRKRLGFHSAIQLESPQGVPNLLRTQKHFHPWSM